MDLRARVLKTVSVQDGVLFGQPAFVGRKMYTGRSIIARNHAFTHNLVDARGYVPVEWWIMSLVQAGNDKFIENEGVTRIWLSDGADVLLTDAVSAAGEALFGEYLHRWPLTKIFDAGGEPVTPSFGGEPEVPPIPWHTHAGAIVDGVVRPPGKLEA